MIILVEPMDAPCMKLEDWCSGVGARSLLEGKLAAIVAATELVVMTPGMTSTMPLLILPNSMVGLLFMWLQEDRA